MNLNDVIILARKHSANEGVAMRSSALLCLADAIKLMEAGEYAFARTRALKSLAYSVGILHPDYTRATK